MTDAEMLRLKNIAGQFAINGAVFAVEPFGNGRINDTFLVTIEGGALYVLQKVNSIFAPTVLKDIDTMTRAMAERGFITTLLIPTREDKIGMSEGGELWRMLTHIAGRTIEEGITAAEAQSAMRLIGKFHQTFADHEYDFQHVRKGFHDTPRIMEELSQAMDEFAETAKHERLGELGVQIGKAYAERPHAWAHLPQRIIHGDPKLNNIRFDENSSRAIALLDLDTMGRHSIVIDIADAARSWCNHADEGDAERARFDLDIFRAMMEGYTGAANFLTQTEREAIPHAIVQITLELAARFATDAYCESYFTLDRERYSDLFAQNSVKALAQFALYRDIVQKLPEIKMIERRLN